MRAPLTLAAFHEPEIRRAARVMARPEHVVHARIAGAEALDGDPETSPLARPRDPADGGETRGCHGRTLSAFVSWGPRPSTILESRPPRSRLPRRPDTGPSTRRGWRC